MKDILKVLFKNRTDFIHLQFFRYIFVGGTSFLIDFIVFYISITFFNINYLIAAAIAFFISVIWNYYASTSWVFNQSNINNKVLEFNIFILISIIGLIFTEILLYLFDIGTNIDYLSSKIIVAIIVLFWNFSGRRILYYGKKVN